MSSAESTEEPGPVGLAMSRRGVIRVAGGTALATVTAGSFGASAAGPQAAAAGSDPVGAAGAPAGGALRLVSHSADLLVRDGVPHYWLSPDIWVVPGTDPNASPGSPVAGDHAYVWARVANTGKDDAVGVQVHFYWANPSVQMRYSGINLIGTSSADIPAGTTQDVLCLVPWQVVTVNGGHECLVVVASQPGDPALPDIVDPVGYPNVAQRNLTVLSALPKGDFRLMVTVSAPRREDKKVQLGWELSRHLPKETLASLGLRQGRPARSPAVVVGMSLTELKEGIGDPVLDLVVPAGKSIPVYVTVRGTSALAPQEYQVINVVERQQGEALGGISFVAVAE